VGSVRSCPLDLDDLGRRWVRVDQLCLDLRVRRVRRVDQHCREHHPCQGHLVDRCCQGCRFCQVDQVDLVDPFDLESSDRLRPLDQERHCCRSDQVDQVGLEVLVVLESHRRPSDRVRRVVHLDPLDRLDQLDQVWPCIRIVVELATISPPCRRPCLDRPCRRRVRVVRRVRPCRARQLDLVDHVGKYSRRRFRCGLDERHA